jgi:hypothetical protein
MRELDGLFPDPPSPTAAEEPPTTEEPAEEPSDPPLPTFTQEPPTTDIMEDLGLEEPPPLPSTFDRKPCPVPGCGKRVKKMWNHIFQVHKGQGHFTDTQLNGFFLGSKAGMPQTPPGTPLEECCFPLPDPETTACPVAGCGKHVKRLWNHMQLHRKRGDTLPQQLHSKRNRWTQEEERILRDEIDITPQKEIPSRKTCQEIIDRNRDVLQKRSKIEIQDKYRRLIRKLG